MILVINVKFREGNHLSSPLNLPPKGEMNVLHLHYKYTINNTNEP